MHSLVLKLILAAITIFMTCSAVYGSELKTRFTTILYDNDDHLRKFNKEIHLGSLSYLMGSRRSITIDEEVRNKIDVITERVETILEMFPKEVKFTIMLLQSEEEVQRIFRTKYGKSVEYVAFYSPRDRTMFVSVRDVDIGILAHEIAHVVIDIYYGMSTPSKIHEVLAQYVETHLKD